LVSFYGTLLVVDNVTSSARFSSSDDLDGTGCVADDGLRDAPQQPTLESCPAMRADHD
jgi:hypothetical protein